MAHKRSRLPYTLQEFQGAIVIQRQEYVAKGTTSSAAMSSLFVDPFVSLSPRDAHVRPDGDWAFTNRKHFVVHQRVVYLDGASTIY